MDATILTTTGDEAGSTTLPPSFETPYRPDIIRKAVDVAETNQKQPYGADPMAGRRHATESWAPGRGASRVPRLTQGREAAFAPLARGGRRAHPPKAEKKTQEHLNRKERDLALTSALAATSDVDRVTERGHRFDTDELPLIVQDDIVTIAKTRELVETLNAIGVGDDLDRAKDGRSIRAGKGTMRGRRYRTPRSVLLVVHDTGTIDRSSGNLPGVEYALVDELNVPRLAPGGDAGRLTVFTESAIAQIEEVLA